MPGCVLAERVLSASRQVRLAAQSHRAHMQAHRSRAGPTAVGALKLKSLQRLHSPGSFSLPRSAMARSLSIHAHPDRVPAPLLLDGAFDARRNGLVQDCRGATVPLQLGPDRAGQTGFGCSAALQRCIEPDTLFCFSPRHPTPSTGQMSGREWRRGAGSRRYHSMVRPVSLS